MSATPATSRKTTSIASESASALAPVPLATAASRRTTRAPYSGRRGFARVHAEYPT
ncbi:MAG: hypothetical protein L3K16_01960 [Thermoplasmata archaeon]|nr:hypothetical protein [Thermoplasmata archaeon]